VFSHQGLTYGGFVFNDKMLLSNSIEVVNTTLIYLNENGIKALNLKLIPTIYHKLPSNEIDYILFLLEAKLYRRDSIAIVDLEHKIPLSRIRKRGIKKGVKSKLVVKEVETFDEFWQDILIPNLQSKYQVKPVHSLEEITYLKSKFPNLIKQYNVYHNAKIVAGITVFEKEKVIHPQYVSGNEDLNNDLGSLDFLYNHLIIEVYKKKKYFDFGISNENQGRNLNESLHYFKESFGARTINQDFYEVKTSNFSLLENILV
ncbi:GNAT family N-acetyltransferase, partial [uncultured Flavobacterium sp.]|uniref:GNAT family N-acetyltransferase n=1 Tax=uncultured Flavobacterium sp. TaxID=165435 RepID=UPI0030CA4D9B